LVVLHDTLSDEDRAAMFGREEFELSASNNNLSSVGNMNIQIYLLFYYIF
jgi:hypothetical protein